MTLNIQTPLIISYGVDRKPFSTEFLGKRKSLTSESGIIEGENFS